MNWIEFTFIYLFGVATGICLFALVCVGYCLDGNTIILNYEKGEKNADKN